MAVAICINATVQEMLLLTTTAEIRSEAKAIPSAMVIRGPANRKAGSSRGNR